MIIWFTGQPGSGKTTLAKRFIEYKLIGFIKMRQKDIINIDGDDLRELLDNKDYSEKGRRKNIQFAIDMAKVLEDKGYVVIVSLVSPYRNMREKLKSERNIGEFYLHTTEVRGKEKYFAKGYQEPLHNYVDINTNKSIEECLDEILAVYRQMARVA